MTERCTAADEILVKGSGKKPYVVSFRDIAPTCTCISFAIGRNRAKARLEDNPTAANGNQDAWCKHIDKLYNDVCRWRGDPTIPGLCPECSHPTDAAPQVPTEFADLITEAPTEDDPELPTSDDFAKLLSSFG